MSGNISSLFELLVIGGVLVFILNIISSAVSNWWRKRTDAYNLQVLFLLELRRLIDRCQGLLDMWVGKKEKQNGYEVIKRSISYSDLVMPTFEKGWEKLLTSKPSFELIDDITFIYEKLVFIKNNIEKADVSRIEILDKKDSDKKLKEEQVEYKVWDEYRWSRAMGFIKEYLNEMYIKYNKTYFRIRKKRRIGFFSIYWECYKFPKKELIYSKDHIDNMRQKLELKV